MGSFLKYLLYLIVLIAVYLLGKGIFDGQITTKSTVGQVASNVEEGAGKLVNDGVNAAENAVGNYVRAPKKDIELGEKENSETEK